MKMIFVVFSTEQSGKSHAVAETIRTGVNLLEHCRRYNANICHLCESRKQAEAIAAAWNESYKTNKTNLY